MDNDQAEKITKTLLSNKGLASNLQKFIRNEIDKDEFINIIYKLQEVVEEIVLSPTSEDNKEKKIKRLCLRCDRAFVTLKNIRVCNSCHISNNTQVGNL